MADVDDETKALQEEAIQKKLNQLITNSKKFHNKVYNFPTSDNRINQIYRRDRSKAAYIVECAENTRIILHRDVFEFMGEFIRHKLEYGSNLEKAVYDQMTPKKLVLRLISKRPLCFFGRHDRSLLRNSDTPPSSAWKLLGSDEEGADEIDLFDYISYDEMQLSALCGISSPTVFINSGARHNQGVKSSADDFEERAVYTGIVGARFEKTDQMESTQIVVAKRNDERAGYGKNGEDSERRKYLTMWAKLYNIGDNNPHFPSYEEVEARKATGLFCPLNRLKAHFNVNVFKRRMRFVVEPFLLDANQRGKEAGKDVYVFAVGLGLGVWAIDSKAQGKYLVAVYNEVIQDQELSAVKVIDFSWFPETVANCGGARHGQCLTADNGNEIEIRFTKRNPADKLEGPYAGMLIVACYAWDGNSFPGNEYWWKMLCASGDPAAASCSMIPEIQNAEVNDTLTKDSAVCYYPQ